MFKKCNEGDPTKEKQKEADSPNRRAVETDNLKQTTSVNSEESSETGETKCSSEKVSRRVPVVCQTLSVFGVF